MAEVPAWARGHRYYEPRYRATPPWADRKAIRKIYTEAARLRARGKCVEVDHIVPLNHPHVCGLHWHKNLRIVPTCENQTKSNHHWPGQWMEQTGIEFEVQLELDYGKDSTPVQELRNTTHL